MISIVIPAFNDSTFLSELITVLEGQTVLPKEVVVVDSSTDHKSSKDMEKTLSNSKLVTKYKKIKRAYAGKSMNLGISMCKNDFIGFLDTKTIPKEDWIEIYLEYLNSDHQVIFGVTKYKALSNFQKLLKAASYGEIGHVTVPGTILKKEVLENSLGFIENVRAGYDREWRDRIIPVFKCFTPKESSISYSKLPESLFLALKKYLLYSFHNARIGVEINLKQSYLSLALFLSGFIITRWNFMLSDWDQNPMYIEDITKIFLLCSIFLLFAVMLVYRWFPSEGPRIFLNSLKVLVFILISYGVYNWNAVIAVWAESAFLYVPHITKIYLFTLIMVSIIFRGLYSPLTKKISRQYLFPLNWLKVASLGLLIDVFKAPGFIFGALISLIKFGK